MRLLSLFSGIGGIDLGLEWAGIETVGQIEINDYCTTILEKHWPNVKRWRDIRSVSAQDVADSIGRIDVIAGGFPCQNISAEGRGGGITGPKSSMWREMFRLIEALRPGWVLIENSPYLRVRGADQLFADLESIDYAYSAQVVGAWCTGLPQSRDRVWVLAYPASFRPQEGPLLDGRKKRASAPGPSRVLVPEKQGIDQRPGEHPRFVPIKPRMALTPNGVPYRLASEAVGNSVVPMIAYLFGTFITDQETAAGIEQ